MSGRANRNFYRVVHDTHWVRGEWNHGGRTEHAAVAYVERCAVQGTDEARRSQSSLAHTGVRMGADVVECKNAFTRVADHDLAAVQHPALHASMWKLGEPHHRYELRIGHDLKSDLGLEDRDGLTDNPDGLYAVVFEFQLDIDTAGAMH